MTAATSNRGRVLESRDAVELLADKWRIPILHLLEPAPLRSGELQRAVQQVSSKVLTQTLRAMERDGLIARKVFTVVPPKVEYRLTLMGRSLIPLLRNLCHWAKSHGDERDRARRDYDHRGKQKSPSANVRSAI